MVLMSLVITFTALTGVVGQAAPPQPSTPAACVKAARDFAIAQQRALKQVTAETVRQIEVEKVAMAQRCAAQFAVQTLPEADLPGLIALYGESAQPALAKAALDRALGSKTLPVALRAEVLAQAVASGLREPKSAERNAKLERYVDELDRLDQPGDALLDITMVTHSRMNGYYRGDDIDDGIIKHSTWLINRGKTFTAPQRTQYGSHIISAHINMAEALAGRGKTTEAQALLAAARSGWSDVPNAARMLDPVIARYALVGTVGAPITAPRWLNAPANTTMPMTGAVTLLEFTAHWCVPCKESYPGLKRLLAKYSPQGFRVVLATELYGYFGMERPLTAEVEFERDRDYWAKEGLTVPVAVANQRSTVDNPNDAAYNVGGIPQIHLLDRQGRIRLIMVGYDDANEPFLASLIEKLLREK
jgi:thiol-disulfide isomerase/thioredoxin